eukprot:CAMPEP_0172423558 /NCGR_PEP_ID=MMETSP1064-20121228/17526_1 /TAXON_ID=202472 /ORGANISM="Aulacoseira subarctica , Strain CCAP 1002/5" /LENGTH=74 /DNA_ID=CAMNT_0013164991 /DNA_START=86 /DNA_END=310 /DNA_ORIENTATION=-
METPTKVTDIEYDTKGRHGKEDDMMFTPPATPARVLTWDDHESRQRSPSEGSSTEKSVEILLRSVQMPKPFKPC